MKDLNRSTASIARQFNLSDTQVHDLFTAYVDLPRLALPEFLSVDEVHIDISEKEKYALVLMDFTTGEIIDILHNRWHHIFESYFPNAVSILDSFHVVKYLLDLINNDINLVIKAYKARDLERLEIQNHDTNRDNKTIQELQEVILLRKYRWVLLKNQLSYVG